MKAEIDQQGPSKPSILNLCRLDSLEGLVQQRAGRYALCDRAAGVSGGWVRGSMWLCSLSRANSRSGALSRGNSLTGGITFSRNNSIEGLGRQSSNTLTFSRTNSLAGAPLVLLQPDVPAAAAPEGSLALVRRSSSLASDASIEGTLHTHTSKYWNTC